jgi:hypothetical protein
MKKKLAVFPLTLVLAFVAWAFVREKAAQDNAGDYFTKREIPTYHLLSLHGDKDRNLIGFCTPCGEKARDVLKDSVKAKFDELEKKATGK